MVFESGRPVGTAALAAYGSIGAPLAILIVPLYNYLPAFYASEVGLNLSIIGAIFFGTRLWDGILDPVVGVWSDRTGVRWAGRRKSWIALAAPLLVVLSWLICIPPENAGYVYLAVVLFLFYAVWTCVQIPHLAWGAELAGSYLERSRVVIARELFFIFGILAAVALPVILFGTSKLDLRAIMELYAWLAAILIPLTVCAAMFLTPDARQVQAPLERPWRDIGQVLKGKRAFCRLLAAYFLTQLGITIYDSTVLFIVTRALELEDMFLIFACLQFVVTIGTLPVIAWLGRYLSKHKLFMVFLVVFPAGVVLLASVPAKDAAAAAVAYVLIGVAVAPHRVMPTSMAADCVDLDRKQYGADRSGAHMAILTLANKLALALGVGIAFPLLDAIGFQSTGVNAGDTLDKLRLVVAIVPAAVMVPAFFMLWNYPITPSAGDAGLVRNPVCKPSG